ncbi:MAG TPA: EAL domain-containing protein [Pseudolabrys sp.]|nr:EAL domain-containing protein [Pseudolabrys sp.]
MTVRLATDHLVNEYVKGTARDWAQFLADNVTDLNEIASGEQPSAASVAFFEATRKSNQVFRYVIFNRDGYSQLVVDHKRIAPVDLSVHSLEAVRAITQGQPVVDIKESRQPDFPAVFAEAFVPAIVNGQPVAAVGAYVDQTEARQIISSTGWFAALSLCLLTAIAFTIPAIAWYRRTREKQRADRRIHFLAHHDALTGLANRARLIERLDSALALVPTVGGRFAVHFIDIDRFKDVNDTFGHDGGDFLLGTVGERLKAMTRIEDFVARLGGDEFVVVQTDIENKARADAFAQRIAAVLGEPMFFREQQIKATVTIGVALAPGDGNTSERLLKSADLALYSGKAAGRCCIRFFAPEMDEALQARLRMERLIRDAIAGNGFVLHYQPVFEMHAKRLLGFEALVRLPAPDGALIQPGDFLPIAEEMRVIDKIGAWVLREACRTAKTWPDDLTVAVNLSPAEFACGDIVDVVVTALNDSGLEAHRLELEITEYLLLGNDERTMTQLRELKELGVSIVMDDFGTGYSSLSYLWKFPFDKIKIDRSFMEGFSGTGRDVETVVKTIIALGRELNMRVTVEGVETINQASFLRGADADQVQSFYFGRPVPASELGASMLKELRKSVADATVQADRSAARMKSRVRP